MGFSFFTKLQEPPLERPKEDDKYSIDETIETFQLWTQSNESCPEGTIPIRRTTEADVLRATSLKRFGRKIIKPVRRDTSSGGHEVSTTYKNRYIVVILITYISHI